MISDMVRYVTMINLTEINCILLLLLQLLLLLLLLKSYIFFVSFKIFNFGQIKMIFCEDENFKNLLYQK